MLIPFFWQTGFRLFKTGFKPNFGLLTFIKMYYYIRKITVCVTRCNVNTLKAVSTPICSRFSPNEVMNMVYTVCFITKPLLIKTAYIKHLPNSNHSVLSHAKIMILQIGPVKRPAAYHIEYMQSVADPGGPIRPWPPIEIGNG